MKVQTVYHHTRYDNLRKIITNKGVSFRGSYFEKFNQDDYEWTKQVASPIIKRICDERGYKYTDDSSFKPIIISFGQEAESIYMWKEYADDYNGIQLILDYKIIKNYADERLDYFNKCTYLNDNTSDEIEDYLRNSLSELRNIDVNNCQYNLEALSGLIKQNRFGKENEIRYVHPYSIMFTVEYSEFIKNGDNAFHDTTPKENDTECFIQLPQEVLLGIAIGYKSVDKIEEVRTYLRECGFDNIEIEIKKNNIEI